MPETAQPTPDAETKRSLGLGRFLVWAFVVVMLYVLSVGPAVKLYNQNKFRGAVTVIYAPIEWLGDNNAPARKLLGMYLHVWCPERYDKNGDHVPN